ncbi:glycosyltransferase family 4 protein [Sphingomonas bacterium]|uniref:glycosyltransferase family 4 protein n=1 Tax=Sphingomonas bacterium TaxID=1895847 RepID=UPI001576D150|nr:glycosyltransferase family 4 protein [Sphingomonas bacterium]
MTSGRTVLVTPNISEQMGGEAIKAYQFLRHLVAGGHDVAVVTHRRSAPVMERDFPQVPTFVVEDTIGQKLAWTAMPLRPLVDMFFFRHARPILRRMLAERPDAIFHYLCPVSPILPRFPLRDATNVLGPLTGNIYYPPAFQREEPMKLKLGRLFHYLAQRVAGVAFGDKRHFGRILVSGGERTRRSLGWAGAPQARMRDVVDSGISDEFDRHPLIRHDGINDRFMTSGRLVPHKGVQLSIEALQYVTRPIRFDIYGDGAYRDALARLAERLGVADKVRFMGWMESHHALIARMAEYRGYLVPSLAEANGIVVQEAMMAGLPVICLRWGGPTMLADQESAILIEPGSQDQVVRAIAAAMDALAADPERANRLVGEARAIAERRFGWDNVADEWQAAYGNG